MTKSDIIRHLKETCRENNFIPNREQQWELFCKVCDNQYEVGHITNSQHKRWTKVF